MIRPGVIKHISESFANENKLTELLNEQGEIKMQLHGFFQGSYENHEANKKENFPVAVIEIAKTGQVFQGEPDVDFEIQLMPLIKDFG